MIMYKDRKQDTVEGPTVGFVEVTERSVVGGRYKHVKIQKHWIETIQRDHHDT